MTPRSHGATDPQPNFLVVLVDQLRASELPAYGGRNVAAPNLDRLAAGGITFDNAISSCPLCTPYRASFMCGLHPTHSGVLVNNTRAYPYHRYLAQLFKDNGYDTGYIGKWHIYRAPGGKDHSQFVPPGPDRLGFDHWEAYNYMHHYHDGFYYRDEPDPLPMDTFETDFETDLAIDYLARHAHGAAPFFLMVSPHPPHPPFDRENCPADEWDRIIPPYDWHPNVGDPQEWEERMRGYLSMIANLDRNMGRLLGALDRLQLSDNTVILFTSDHGEMMGAHGFRGKCRPYRESIGVPLILRQPNVIPAGVRTDYPQSQLDYLPTLCAMAGIPVEHPVDGADLTGLWTGAPVPQRAAVLAANYSAGSKEGKLRTGPAQVGTGGAIEWRAVKTRTHTYVRWIDNTIELFDDRTDPHQLTNLAANSDAGDVKREMEAYLDRLLEEANDQLCPGNQYAHWYDEELVELRVELPTATAPLP